MLQEKFDDSPPGIKLLHPLVGRHRQRIRWMAWSPNGAFLASSSDDRSIRLWDMRSRKSRDPLLGHNGPVYGVAWSPDGRRLASCSGDQLIYIWDVASGRQLASLKGHTAPVYGLAWSPRAPILASCSADRTVRLWDTVTFEQLEMLIGHSGPVYSVAWSPHSHALASASGDTTIRIWNSDTRQLQRELKAHFGPVHSVAWSRDDVLASGSRDRTVRLWDPHKGASIYQFEGHTDSISGVSFSFDGRLIASQCHDGSVWVWNAGFADPYAQIEEHLADPVPDWLDAPMKNVAFHPSSYTLATLISQDYGIQVCELLPKSLPGALRSANNIQYTNAKVVLVGESGVGKTGLARALLGEPYIETDSTHGRHVWTFETNERQIHGKPVMCETILWDLAGQPGYRVFHQLHLSEVAIALVVFDARKDADPFSGVAYWVRALDAAAQGRPLVKFLVAARTDRGSIPVSRARINEIKARYQFKDYIETSARNATGVSELANAIRGEIDWENQAIVSTPELFRQMKQFLVAEKELGRILQMRSKLLERFRQEHPKMDASSQVFDTCLGQLEAVGLIRRLLFRELTLLQPEILDNYCAWLAQSAQAEPNGLGCLPQHEALAGKFKMDTDRLLAPDAQRVIERYIILATIDEVVVGRSIAWLEKTTTGEMLVFPSEMRADLSDYPGDYIREVAFQFEGPVAAIYATLAVQLINSGEFTKEALYKNAAVLRDAAHRICGFVVEYPDRSDDAVGRLTVFFEPGTAANIKPLLLRYVNRQLERMALPASIQRERIYQCACGYTIPSEAVERRKQRRKHTVICPVCEITMPLDDLAEQSTRPDERVTSIEAEADAEQQRQKRLLVLSEREKNNEYDVFVCHNPKDRALATQLAGRLREQGILPWIDVAGAFAHTLPTPDHLKHLAQKVGVIAVVMGSSALGQPSEQEYHRSLLAFTAYIRQVAPERPRPAIIPVFLPDVPRQPERLAAQLRTLPAIDFRPPDGLDNREQMKSFVDSIVQHRT